MIRSSYFENSVSRETFQKINKYHEFLIENNKKLSLISKKSEEIAVKRHYEDCAQIIKSFRFIHYATALSLYCSRTSLAKF